MTQPTAMPRRTAHASGLSSVERELAALHRAMLRGGEEGRGVRLSVLTLVVACTTSEEADRAAEVVAAIATHHPARALLVVADPRAPAAIDADLSLACTLAGGRDQVCAETVRITVGGDAALRLLSVVTPLLLPDVPVMLWVAGAPRLAQTLAPTTLAITERVVLDTQLWGDPGAAMRELAAAVERAPHGLPVSDLAWARLRPWRELVARAFDAPPRRPFVGGVTGVTIRSGGAGGSAEALLMAGWLASRLRLGAEAVVLEAGGAGAAPTLEAVAIEARHGEHALRVAVEAAGDALVTAVVLDGEDVAGRTVPRARPVLADLVGAALQEHGIDAVHLAAVRAAAAR